MRVLNFIGLAALVSVAGCAVNPERIAVKSDIDLCESYGIFSQGLAFGAMADQYKNEMLNRKLLEQDEWSLVEQKKIKRGMSECALLASWGKPQRVNKSVGSWGTNTQRVYNAGMKYIKPSYVYTQNGKVTSWQN